MFFIIAGILAAAAVWSINCLLLFLTKEKAILVSPVIEETAKTSMALLFGASILFTHLTFGLIEALWDLSSSRKLGATSALLSVGGHFVFGFVSQEIFYWRANIFYAVSSGLILHLIWNYLILKLIKSAALKRGRF